MQKSPQENGKVGLEHPERWLDDAQHFLAETTSLTSAKALSKVCGTPITLRWGADTCSNRYCHVDRLYPAVHIEAAIKEAFEDHRILDNSYATSIGARVTFLVATVCKLSCYIFTNYNGVETREDG
jgi:hypothetical protein